MGKYTWDDIIINPNSEQAKACIGKEVYCADTPYYCLEKANDNEVYDTVCILQKILPNDNYPFRLGESAEYEHCCIIPKKEEEPEYVPFDNIKELIEASLDHNNFFVSQVGGIWLKSKEDGIICLITSLNINKNYLYFDCEPYGLDNILDDFCFLDDTPCGKLKE